MSTEYEVAGTGTRAPAPEPDDHMVSNEFADDCTMVACVDGELDLYFPANFEVPPQVSPTDCEFQVCSDGEVLTADYLDEPGC